MSKPAAKVPGASSPLTWAQKVRVIAQRLRDPKVQFTQGDRRLLAQMIEDLEQRYQTAMRADNSIIFTGERTHSRH